MRRRLLGVVRRLLKEVDLRIEKQRHPVTAQPGNSNGLEREIEEFLTNIETGGTDGAAYLRQHLRRLVRTLSLVPIGNITSRALDLGSYLHIPAALQRVLGYGTVRATYYYPAEPVSETKVLRIARQLDFVCEVDLFDAERHAFPYPDSAFDLVLCCEMIEHMLRDPIHVLVECHRVLAEGGRLLITTPNTASFTSVACVLHGWRNPQVYSCYPAPGAMDVPHVREYTPWELSDALVAAGFAVEALFTERIAVADEGAWVQALLEEQGFDTSLRGEQIYCVARKRPGSAPKERYPAFLYSR